MSSIWHLAAVDMNSYSGRRDLKALQNRFDTFVGLSESDLTIKSGFERLNTRTINQGQRTDKIVGLQNNKEMKLRASKLDVVRERWEEALVVEESARVVPSVELAKTPRIRKHVLENSFRYLSKQLAGGTALALLLSLGLVLISFPGLSFLFFSIAIGTAGVLFYKSPETIRVLKTALYYLPVDGGLKRIGTALMEALSKAEFINTSDSHMWVEVAKQNDGSFFVSLQGATFYESSLFADCIDEILSPIDSPRYLVVRKGSFLGQERVDYHAVPMRFGVRKELASIFHRAWEKYVSPTELVYTRTEVGRKALLKAKMRSFSSNFSKHVKRLDRWQ